MLLKPARLWPLLCLALALHLAVAQAGHLARRQDEPLPAPTTAAPRPEPPGAGDARTSSRPESTGGTDGSTTSLSATERPSATSQTSSQPSPTATTSAAAENGDADLFNVTIPDGQLPLEPQVTPGWAVAGVVMLLTGAVYTLVGIRNRFVHTFFSTAYLTALAIAVLIVYVMTLPVSNAAQGGYVVAVVVSGCAFGAASMFFKDLTENLGCALGGFCVSMWLLCLVPGGLLDSVASKAAFVAALTLGAWAFYFSRWTRDWALITMMAFAGATVVVLGIDCFSRAGLKEFWVYVWNVNGNLFPPGARTYPVTKGIRVETAAIFITFLIGIVSQIKLWRIVRETRDKKAAERAQGQRSLEQEEENVGRQVEEANARERRQWERIYGDGTLGSVTDSHLSDLGDIGSEKRLHAGSGSLKHRSSAEAIEMADMSESDQSRSGQHGLMAEEARDGKVTVRVAADDYPATPSDVDELNEKAAGLSEERLVSTVGTRFSQPPAASKRVSQAQTVADGPEVVPLPFSVPAAADARSDGDRSSIATFADDGDAPAPTRPQRHSLVKRLSRGSLTLLRGIRRGGGGGGDDDGASHDNGDSSDELVVPAKPHRARDEDDNGTLAATVDGESVSSGSRCSRGRVNSDVRRSIEINAELAEREGDGQGEAACPSPPAAADSPASRQDEPPPPAASGPPAKAKSTASAASTRASLTKERLPRSLSRVAMSYRTNEWAKHLSYADTPQPDALLVGEPAQPAAASAERAAPVDVTELQKTAEDGAPAPAVTRSESRASNLSSYVPSVSRRASRLDSPDPQARSPGWAPAASAAALRRTPSASAALAQPIPEEAADARSAHGGDGPPRSPVPGVVSFSRPQTLLGQREMLLRNRSQGSLPPGTPEPAVGPGSDGGSLCNALGVADADDIPLSQRKEMMRQSSLASLPQSNASLTRLSSAGHDAGDGLAFNSHQPRRVSMLPTASAREAQLASFRQSVQHELRAGTPVMATSARETPFAPSSLLGSREAEVQRNIEMQRNVLMGQKEAEAQRKELQRREREVADRAFDERMRSGDLLEAHREAMRKLQRAARDR